MVANRFVRSLAGLAFRLPRRTMANIDSETIAMPMRDGSLLRADRYFPVGSGSGPVVLLRSPYRRGMPWSLVAQLMAERGFHAIVQDVRGTGDSEGSFYPFRNERADGADTLAWIHAQPWCAGKVFGFGPSYLGYVQWAMAREAPDRIHGMALLVTLADFRQGMIGFGPFHLATKLTWVGIMQTLLRSPPGAKLSRPDPKAMDPHFPHLPVGTMDQAAFGERIDWWQDWMAHERANDPWWQPIDCTAAAASDVPILSVAGWHDIFLPFQIKDFEARQATGQDNAWLTIGPWHHGSIGAMIECARQAATVFPALARGENPFPQRAPVRYHVQNAGEWREAGAWPPPDARPMALYLRAGARLDAAPPSPGEGASTFTYDPADPTPSLHGAAVTGVAKRRDMSPLEARGDTISFTGEALDADLDLAGPVSVEISFRSDRENADIFVCLCDVDRRGRPQQVTDGILRLRPGEPPADAAGVRRVTVECWPTAYRFRRGHRLRLIVAGGAHPRYSRNPGTGEATAAAVEMQAARHEILHDASYPTVLQLRRLD